MKAALAVAAFVAAAVFAAPAAAELPLDDAARLANVAFDATCNVTCNKAIGGHSRMDASTVEWHGDHQFAWFRTIYLGPTIDGLAVFAVDRRTGAVWSLKGLSTCVPVTDKALNDLRGSLSVTHGVERPMPPADCNWWFSNAPR